MPSLPNIPAIWQTVLLLSASNVFMTLGWYTTRNTCRVSQNAIAVGVKPLSKRNWYLLYSEESCFQQVGN